MKTVYMILSNTNEMGVEFLAELLRADFNVEIVRRGMVHRLEAVTAALGRADAVVLVGAPDVDAAVELGMAYAKGLRVLGVGMESAAHGLAMTIPADVCFKPSTVVEDVLDFLNR